MNVTELLDGIAFRFGLEVASRRDYRRRGNREMRDWADGRMRILRWILRDSAPRISRAAGRAVGVGIARGIMAKEADA